MKSLGGLAFCLLFIIGCKDQVSSSGGACRTHLPLDMTTAEYSRCLNAEGILKEMPSAPEDKALHEILRVGQRSLQWVSIVNPFSASETKGHDGTKHKVIPKINMRSPSMYNGTTVIQGYIKTLQSMPQTMRETLLGNAPLPIQINVSRNDFNTFTSLIERSYDGASRWLLLKPQLDAYTEQRRLDIRGYYFLSQDKNLKQTLASYSSLPPERKDQIKEWLLQMCYAHTGSDGVCAQNWERGLEENQGLFDFYQTYASYNKKTFDDFFKIQIRRNDVAVSSRSYSVPFSNPDDSGILSFVKDSVEARWKGSNWLLTLSVMEFSTQLPHIVFAPAATPHVDRLAGSIITMDKNIALSDLENQNVVAHEFGHLLGFPDCYVEFFDTKTDLMVNYQIDTDNIMCSRGGKVLPIHSEQMQANYGTR